jgi:hypothetical protein
VLEVGSQPRGKSNQFSPGPWGHRCLLLPPRQVFRARVYGWGVVIRWPEELNRRCYFRPVSPSDQLKLFPWCTEEAWRIADLVRGPGKDDTISTIAQVSTHLATAICARITAWVTGSRQPISVADLFQNEPRQMGLRGDRYLWTEMACRLECRDWPRTAEEFVDLVEQLFQELTGCPISHHADSIFVERYSHGGMSSGYVCTDFWRKEGLPLLRGRYLTSRTAYTVRESHEPRSDQ